MPFKCQVLKGQTVWESASWGKEKSLNGNKAFQETDNTCTLYFSRKSFMMIHIFSVKQQRAVPWKYCWISCERFRRTQCADLWVASTVKETKKTGNRNDVMNWICNQIYTTLADIPVCVVQCMTRSHITAKISLSHHCGFILSSTGKVFLPFHINPIFVFSCILYFSMKLLFTILFSSLSSCICIHLSQMSSSRTHRN